MTDFIKIYQDEKSDLKPNHVAATTSLKALKNSYETWSQSEAAKLMFAANPELQEVNQQIVTAADDVILALKQREEWHANEIDQLLSKHLQKLPEESSARNLFNFIVEDLKASYTVDNSDIHKLTQIVPEKETDDVIVKMWVNTCSNYMARILKRSDTSAINLPIEDIKILSIYGSLSNEFAKRNPPVDLDYPKALSDEINSQIEKERQRLITQQEDDLIASITLHQSSIFSEETFTKIARSKRVQNALRAQITAEITTKLTSENHFFAEDFTIAKFHHQHGLNLSLGQLDLLFANKNLSLSFLLNDKNLFFMDPDSRLSQFYKSDFVKLFELSCELGLDDISSRIRERAKNICQNELATIQSRLNNGEKVSFLDVVTFSITFDVYADIEAQLQQIISQLIPVKPKDIVEWNAQLQQLKALHLLNREHISIIKKRIFEIENELSPDRIHFLSDDQLFSYLDLAIAFDTPKENIRSILLHGLGYRWLDFENIYQRLVALSMNDDVELINLLFTHRRDMADIASCIVTIKKYDDTNNKRTNHDLEKLFARIVQDRCMTLCNEVDRLKGFSVGYFRYDSNLHQFDKLTEELSVLARIGNFDYALPIEIVEMYIEKFDNLPKEEQIKSLPKFVELASQLKSKELALKMDELIKANKTTEIKPYIKKDNEDKAVIPKNPIALSQKDIIDITLEMTHYLMSLKKPAIFNTKKKVTPDETLLKEYIAFLRSLLKRSTDGKIIHQLSQTKDFPQQVAQVLPILNKISQKEEISDNEHQLVLQFIEKNKLKSGQASMPSIPLELYIEDYRTQYQEIAQTKNEPKR